MKSTFKAGAAGLSLLALVVFVPSCTRDTAQSDNAAKSSPATDTTGYAENAPTTDMSGSTEIDNRPLGLTAHLVEEDMHARERAATVQVEVTGIRLVDPESAMEGGGAYGTSTSGTATSGVETGTAVTSDSLAAGAPTGPKEGHIHYRLDGGPVIATPATRLSFHELSPGQHTITVMLASPNHAPLGPQETLTFTIPS